MLRTGVYIVLIPLAAVSVISQLRSANTANNRWDSTYQDFVHWSSQQLEQLDAVTVVPALREENGDETTKKNQGEEMIFLKKTIRKNISTAKAIKPVALQEHMGKFSTTIGTSRKKSRIIMTTVLFGDSVPTKPVFRMWLATLAHSDLDWALVGDARPNYELPPNVKYYNVSWPQLTQRVWDKLFNGTEPEMFRNKPQNNLKNAGYRKVNDLKPLVAYLWPEIVEGYEFWGTCDNDMMVGNVSKFLPDAMLDNYDIIGGSEVAQPFHVAWGPWTIYRNTKLVNELFMHVDFPEDISWLKTRADLMAWLFASSSHHYFDEWYNTKKARRGTSIDGVIQQHANQTFGLRVTKGKGFILWDKDECLFPYAQTNDDFSMVPDRCGECVFHKGTLLLARSGQEIMACHWHRAKKWWDDALMPMKKLHQLAASGHFRGNYKYGYLPVMDDGPTGDGGGKLGGKGVRSPTYKPPYKLGARGDKLIRLGQTMETVVELQEKEKQKKLEQKRKKKAAKEAAETEKKKRL